VTTFIVLASIAAYLTIATFVGRFAMSNIVHNTITEQAKRIETFRYHYPDAPRTALKLSSQERSSAIKGSIVVGLLWPGSLLAIGVTRVLDSAVDSEVRKAVAEREELTALRAIAEREGWKL